MPQNPNDPVERPPQGREPRPEIERERAEDITGLEDDEDIGDDVDPDSAESENDRDDMLTD